MKNMSGVRSKSIIKKMLSVQNNFKGVVFESQNYKTDRFEEIFKQIKQIEYISSSTETKEWKS